MNTTIFLKRFLLTGLIGFMAFGCTDNVPDIEDLPSAAVNFNYEVVDDTYQLD